MSKLRSGLDVRLILPTLTLALVLVAPAWSQAESILFRVRMAHQIDRSVFDPIQDFVDLAGTFNAWGNDPLIPLSDADGDSIYEVLLSGFTPGDTIEFKFRMDGVWDGREEFAGGGPNRNYTVTSGSNEILVWYDDRPPDAGVGELSWWNDTVFYEIFVRSFYDSDGDGVGDFQGLTQELDYLNDGDPGTTDDLGITGIWLMPINDSPSYHGYDSVDYRSINPDYGTMADFEAFLAAAHARGIRVIIDYVMNHASNQHPWFVASAQGDPTYRDYFVWSPSDPGQIGPWGQQVWHPYGPDYYYGLFYGGMPDLNYDTPALKAEMFDTAAWWLDTVGVDGFRLDAVLYIDETGDQLQNTQETLDFWREFNLHVKSIDPDVLSVGEAWTNSYTVNEYVIEDRLDFCFEFDLAGAIVGAVDFGDAQYLAFHADRVFDLYPYGQFGTFLTNHDQNRVLNILGEDESKQKVAAGIYLTLPGVPFLYYGEEVGLLGTKPDEDIRRPMQWNGGTNAGFTTGTPWNAVGPNFATHNVQDASNDSGSLLAWYRELISLRADTPALRRGDHRALWSSEASVLAFLRSFEGQTILCLANTSAAPLSGVTLYGSPAALTPGTESLVNLLDPMDTFDITVTGTYQIEGLSLGGHEVAVYEFENATGIGSPGEKSLETGVWLAPNSPNPFTPSTTIRYALPRATRVKLKVYDMAGREVAHLHDGVQDAGIHEVQWTGRDDRRQRLAAGVYFVRLDAGGQSRVDKMVLVD